MSLVCQREKKWIGWSRTQKPVLRPFSFFTIRPIFIILQPLGSGYHERKVNELPDWDWAWSDGTKAANRRSRKGYLCEWFFLAVIHPTFKDAPWKESLDDLELFYDQRRKSVRIIWNYCSLRNEMEQNETKRNEMKICSLRNENL